MTPLTEAGYLAELPARAGGVLGGDLVGVYAGGSWALGDYLPGRSDLDVAIVCATPLDDEAIGELARRLRHESLPCPARGLELVVYTRAAAAAGGTDPGFELNLNTGAGIPWRLERRGDTEEGHWYAIDRSLLAENGRALSGPPAGAVFRSPPRPVVLDLLRESLRWHEHGDAAPDDTVLNAARTLFYAREGHWTSKPRAAEWLARRGEHAELMEAALAAREGRGDPPGAEAVSGFVRTVGAALA